MGTSFNDYVAKSRANASADQAELAAAFDAHFEATYQEHFGLSAQLVAAQSGGCLHPKAA